MEERWVVAAKRADFNEIGRKFGIDPVIARIIRNRDVVGDEAIRSFLHGGLEDLHEPRLMHGMLEALSLIQEGVRSGQKMRVIGDYDIDGVSATYILVSGLERIGAVVDTYIPDRVGDGYGMHEHLVRRAADDGIQVIITCDNGIAAYKEIALAKELGIQVVVTDHHNVPYEERDGVRREILPPADVILNPKQEQCGYPFKGLCGAAVAYKLVQALYERYSIPTKEHEQFLEIAAVATVGDVMDLEGENRILVKEGLRRLKSPCNLGLKALIAANELEGKTLAAYHIGFVLGPCINASGRLDTAARSLDLLRSQSEAEAAKMAGDLLAMNQSRKALTAEGVDEAVEMVETTSLKEDRVLVVYLPECHESLAGIIAGRLRERYYKPAFVLTKGEYSVKGSGRSIEAYSMYDELVKCSDLLIQFGGHPMAAGLSLEEENVPRFRKRLNELCTLTEEELMPKVAIDVPMPVSYISKSFVKSMEVLEPFGKANPKPLFAQKNLQILDKRVMGQNRNVVRLRLQDEAGCIIDGVYFGDGDRFVEDISGKSSIDIVYYPQINEWQGRESLRITIQNYR